MKSRDATNKPSKSIAASNRQLQPWNRRIISWSLRTASYPRRLAKSKLRDLKRFHNKRDSCCWGPAANNWVIVFKSQNSNSRINSCRRGFQILEQNPISHQQRRSWKLLHSLRTNLRNWINSNRGLWDQRMTWNYSSLVLISWPSALKETSALCRGP